MSADRDTHFQGFAKLLCDDLLEAIRNYKPDGEWNAKEVYRLQEQCIAQRAYDLVTHALDKANTGYMIGPENDIADVPDLTEWPERS